MKTFKDLEFKQHHIGAGRQAIINFDNGYGLSIIIGDIFYSNGIDTYEVATLMNEIYNGEEPVGYLSEDDVESIMKEVQGWNKPIK